MNEKKNYFLINSWTRLEFVLILSFESFLLSMVLIVLNMHGTPDGISSAADGFRIGTVERFMAIIRAGGIPEFTRVVDHSNSLYFFIPYIGVKFNISDVIMIFRYVQMLGGFICSIIFPFEIHYIFRNRTASVVSPIFFHIFLGNILYGWKTDVYWGSAFASVLALPLLYKLIKMKGKKGVVALTIALGLISTLGNLLRNHNSAVVLLLFVIIIVIKTVIEIISFISNCERKIKTILITSSCSIAFGVLMLILYWGLYNSLSEYLPTYVGRKNGVEPFNIDLNNFHAFLGGLGYYENDYGVAWDDPVIAAAACNFWEKNHNGEVVMGYNDSRYGEACKELYFYILKDNPGFVIKSYIKKFIETISMEINYLVNPVRKENALVYYYAAPFTVKCILVPCLVMIMILCRTTILNGKWLACKRLLVEHKWAYILALIGGGLGTYQDVIGAPLEVYAINSMICMTLLPVMIGCIWIAALCE